MVLVLYLRTLVKTRIKEPRKERGDKRITLHGIAPHLKENTFQKRKKGKKPFLPLPSTLLCVPLPP
jgi:hypothetical protein